MYRKQTALLALAALLATSSAALGEAPESQFGFDGWPYHSVVDASPVTSAPTHPAAAPTRTEPCATSPGETPPNGSPSATFAPNVPSQPAVPPTSMPGGSTAPTQAPSMDEDYTTDAVSAQEQNAWQLLNADRAEQGRAPLPLDPALSAIARAKSEDMRDRRYFSHVSPTYGTVSEMLAHFGYPAVSAGENIAHHATVERAQIAFLSSAGHRRNVLSSSWQKVGIGVAFDRDGFVYVTQLYAR